MVADDLDETTLRVNVRCGACLTWRAATLNRAEEHAVVTRIERIQRRQRRGIARDLRLLSAAHAAGYQPATRIRAAK